MVIGGKFLQSRFYNALERKQKSRQGQLLQLFCTADFAT